MSTKFIANDEGHSTHSSPKRQSSPISTYSTGGGSASGYSNLRQMAFDLISIPAMSAEVERVFSSAKKLLTPERNALTPEHLEIYEVLRNWWLRDIVLQSAADVISDDSD